MTYKDWRVGFGNSAADLGVLMLTKRNYVKDQSNHVEYFINNNINLGRKKEQSVKKNIKKNKKKQSKGVDQPTIP